MEDNREARNGEIIAAHVEWAAKVAATSSTSLDEFADACAVMFSFVQGAPILMGAEHQRVNIRLWHGDDAGPFTMTAAGIGISERIHDGILQTKARHPWQIALALWHGANQERTDLKSFSPMWTQLEIAP